MDNLHSFGHQFYPTPLPLGLKMVQTIDWKNHTGAVLDVAAGKGDLLMAYAVRESRFYPWLFKGNHEVSNRRQMQFEVLAEDYESTLEKALESGELRSIMSRTQNNLWAIEIDQDLQNVLRGRGIKVIGSDFLTYSDMLQPSVILMNPPFDQGDQFLLRAMDYLYSGQICCILNAQTLKNPYTNTRKDLVRRLEKAGAKIEFLEGQFCCAERPTGVEVAMVTIDQRRTQEQDDVFAQCKDEACDFVAVDECEQHSGDLVFADRIEALVQHYEAKKQAGVEFIIKFETERRDIPYLSLSLPNFEPSHRIIDSPSRKTELLKAKINHYLVMLRKDSWSGMLNDPAITKYLTRDKKQEYLKQLEQYSLLDFTVGNIRTFVAKISADYPETLGKAIEDVFDEFTTRHTYYDDCKNNTHYYNGWKTNKAHRVNHKVIVPRLSPFDTSWGKWRNLGYRVAEKFNDYEKVLSYFDGGRQDFTPMSELIDKAIDAGQTSRIETEYFWVTMYQKGTVHLTFKDKNVLRRFNIFAGARKGFLPPDYGNKPKDRMNEEEKQVAENFEGLSAYKVDHGVNPFANLALGQTAQKGQTLELPFELAA